MIEYIHKNCSSCQDMGAALRDFRILGSWTEVASEDGHGAHYREDT